MSIRILGVGDAMLLHPFPAEYSNSDIKNYISKADVSLANLEMVLATSKVHASTFCGGQWVCSEQDNFKYLNDYGFDMYACANNHSMDYSFDGVIETCDFLKQENALYAGIGRSLEDATKPVYFSAIDSNGEKKIIGMISLTTTFIDAARAGDKNEFFSARPGVNGLRHKEEYFVSAEEMEVLKQIAEKTYINGERDNARKIGSLPKEASGTFNFGGIFFRETENEGKITTCDGRDLERIINSIIDAKTYADYVVVMAHSHQIKHGSYTEPDYFFEEFCHKCIDAGAICVFGGGTHQLKPIEIYKGCPIFYSLGNFIFQNHMVDKLPADFWDKYNYPTTLSVKEALNIKSKNGTIGLEKDINNFLSVIPQVTISNDKVTSITMKPISLNFYKDSLKGLPNVASIEETKYIFDYLQEISSIYGTKFGMEENEIVVCI